MFLTTPVNLLMGKKTEKIAHAESGCKLSFAAISDIHLDEKASFYSDGIFETGLKDMSEAKDRLDAVCFTGDITNHGEPGQWDIFTSSMKKFNIADNLFLIVGNHDTWGPSDEPIEVVHSTFYKYSKEATGRDIDRMYYSDIVNGYYFICLGSEDDGLNAYISDEQFEWFEGEMEKAGSTGLPIFVFMHQPVNQTHGLPYNWELDKSDPDDKGGIGERSDEIVEVFKKYDNVFYFTGHIHAGFKTGKELAGPDYASVEYIKNNNGNNVTLVNIPCFANPDVIRGAHMPSGCGFVVEAYDGKVLIRARNFSAGTWLTKYDVTVEIV